MQLPFMWGGKSKVDMHGSQKLTYKLRLCLHKVEIYCTNPKKGKEKKIQLSFSTAGKASKKELHSHAR